MKIKVFQLVIVESGLSTDGPTVQNVITENDPAENANASEEDYNATLDENDTITVSVDEIKQDARWEKSSEEGYLVYIWKVLEKEIELTEVQGGNNTTTVTG